MPTNLQIWTQARPAHVQQSFYFQKTEEPLKLLFFYKEQFPKTKFEKKKQITPTWAKYLFNLSKVL